MKYLTLTLVHLPDEATVIDKFIAYTTLLPLYIISAITASILTSRHAFTVLVGLVFNEYINWTLKHWIKEPRPLADRTGYGMPSSHAQFMSFFLVSCLVLTKSPSASASAEREYHGMWLSRRGRRLVVLLAWISCLLVCYSRVYLGYHSMFQVQVGFMTGVGLAIVYYRTPMASMARQAHYVVASVGDLLFYS